MPVCWGTTASNSLIHSESEESLGNLRRQTKVNMMARLR